MWSWLKRLFPENIFARKIDPSAERRLRLAQARAEESITRAHADNTLTGGAKRRRGPLHLPGYPRDDPLPPEFLRQHVPGVRLHLEVLGHPALPHQTQQVGDVRLSSLEQAVPLAEDGDVEVHAPFARVL